jgi:hypothetical protein
MEVNYEEIMPKEEILKLNLPSDLVKYLVNSNRIKDKLFRYALLDIQELYLYYSCIYEFSNSAFSDHAISAISRANNSEKFYFYAKKIMDENLTFVEKQGLEESNLKLIHIHEEKFLKLLDETQKAFIDIVDKMFNKESVNLPFVYTLFGKVEMALQLNHDEYLERLFVSAKRVLNSYLEIISENVTQIESDQ